ncbi:unnamed protein product, partial [marine sediment metagenome]
PGETYYTVLLQEGLELVRVDYAPESWPGPPESAMAWWKSKIPDAKSARKHWAPNDVMLDVFDQLGEDPKRADERYILALLLVRRRVMRIEQYEKDEDGRDMLAVFCPRRDETYQVAVIEPSPERTEEIQDQLAQLLQ